MNPDIDIDIVKTQANEMYHQTENLSHSDMKERYAALWNASEKLFEMVYAKEIPWAKMVFLLDVLLDNLSNYQTGRTSRYNASGCVGQTLYNEFVKTKVKK